MLESLQHSSNAFITLTYEDANLVRVPSTVLVDGAPSLLPTLVPKHLRDWLKRYRKALAPSRIRFFAVGEYGDQLQRPHYHVAAFGAPTCQFLRSRYSKIHPVCCPACELVRKTWGFGHVFLGTLEENSAGYIAGYCVKKMGKADDPRLLGRHPEFPRMSRRPGIGAWAMDEVAHTLMQYKLDEKLSDVPDSLLMGKKPMPLGRFLRQNLRKKIGRDVKTPLEVLEAMAAELLPLHRIHERYSALFDFTFRWSTLNKEDLVEANKQKILNMEGKFKIHNRGTKL